jgi:phosphoglycerol transferase MdoB-like AlkP superfamily enzyme
MDGCLSIAGRACTASPSLIGRVAVITGGNAGIGKASAIRYDFIYSHELSHSYLPIHFIFCVIVWLNWVQPLSWHVVMWNVPKQLLRKLN